MLCKAFHRAQGGTQSVEYKLIPKVDIDFLRRFAIRETLDTPIMKFFNTTAASDRQSKVLLTLPNATFVSRRTNSSMKQKKHTTTFTPKDAIDTVVKYNDVTKSIPSRSKPGGDEPPRREPSRRSSKFSPGKHEFKEVKGHLSYSASSKNKHDSRSKS